MNKVSWSPKPRTFQGLLTGSISCSYVFRDLMLLLSKPLAEEFAFPV